MNNQFYIRIFTLLTFIGAMVTSCVSTHKHDNVQQVSAYYTEPYRPQYHFTPDSMWMNDPNGMVFYDGEYHLFYQYYPDSTVWGPMHWGHAISTDLTHWEHLPIAIYPDSLGWIFSGSAVVDWKNTSGLGNHENPPLIAVFTYHFSPGQKAGKIDFQTQGMAYSLDKGRTWKMYEENPVLNNPGIQDFRDPKVCWYEEGQKWIMTLAVKDHISFYSSANLKSWVHESDFGFGVGAHGGVWECPDLFKMKGPDGVEKWVLFVSINPGGPNGGSATQYFIGDFNGSEFINENPSSDPVWLDWGKDNYAGVTWSDIPKEDGRRIFMGWMSNWQYATVVPTQKWRSGMTMPRTLKLLYKDSMYLIAAKPVEEIETVLKHEQAQQVVGIDITQQSTEIFESKVSGGAWMSVLKMNAMDSKTIRVTMKNANNEEASLILHVPDGKVEFDRTKAGKRDFSEDFAQPIIGNYAFADSTVIKVEMYWDENGFEIFVNDGEFQMTNLVFPNDNWNCIELSSDDRAQLVEASYIPIRKTWVR